MSSGENERLAGRYRIVRRLGRGGMGVVWCAVDEVLGREVAVKELRTFTDAAGPEVADLRIRMQREARAAARIRHPGVVAVHDVAEHEGRPVIVMELVDGPSMDDVLTERGVLDPREAARIGAHVLEALAAAHAAGVLHRDVKPGNILLDRSGRIVLTDFGIAAMEDPDDGSATRLTRSGDIVGSLDYLAPERARGQDPGPASDVWALGATLYAAVEGSAPFRRTSTWSTLSAIVTEPLPEPRRAGPLAGVLLRLLDKDPALRPDATAAARLLAEVAEGRDPTATTRLGGAVPASRTPGGRPDDPRTAPQTSPPATGGGFGPPADGAGGAGQGRPDAPAGGAAAEPDPRPAPGPGSTGAEWPGGAARDPVPASGAAPGAPEAWSSGSAGPRPAAPAEVPRGSPLAPPAGAAAPAGPHPAAPGGPGDVRAARRRAGILVAAAVVAVVLAGSGLTYGLMDHGATGRPSGAAGEGAAGATGAEDPAGVLDPGDGSASSTAQPGGKDSPSPGNPDGSGSPAAKAPTSGGGSAAGGSAAGAATAGGGGSEPSAAAGGGASGTAEGAGTRGGATGTTTTSGGTGSPSPDATGCTAAGSSASCQVLHPATTTRYDGGEMGTVGAGPHTFFCQVDLDRSASYAGQSSRWWARTDDDSGNTNVYVSVAYLRGSAGGAPVPGLRVC
ncbi:protein kinase [Streptomyces sp. NPDC085614]|uniref:serine/threonine-protein kinase n=1 Tax=Streptomyces sp. NPDC085614 TaxID=3365733 RepID=UPI0037D88D00